MIQKTLLVTVAVGALLLSGCSQKTPELEGAEVGKNNVSDATQIAGETVAINENAYGNENTVNTSNISTTESNSDVLNGSSVNSSSDGFKSLYFGFGDYSISSSMENRMVTNSSVATKQSSKIKIEGNCDEFGTDEYNYALGLKRAKAVKDNMVSQGVNAQKIVIVSFGESNPVCSNPTDGCYARNRRVDLRLAQ